MKEDLLVQRLKESIHQMDAHDWEEVWAELRRQGIIDERGRVLKRMPAPPYERDAQGNLKKNHRQRKGKPRRRTSS